MIYNLYLLPLKKWGRGAGDAVPSPNPSCSASLTIEILGHEDNKGGIIIESNGIERPGVPNRFSKQDRPIRLDFCFCETEIKSYCFKVIIVGGPVQSRP